MNCKSEASLGYLVRQCFNINQTRILNKQNPNSVEFLDKAS